MREEAVNCFRIETGDPESVLEDTNRASEYFVPASIGARCKGALQNSAGSTKTDRDFDGPSI
jgi:hypothetical protein